MLRKLGASASTPSEKALQDLSMLVDRRAEQVIRAMRRESREYKILSARDRRTPAEKSSTLAIIVSQVDLAP
jgi:hypothetical protein